MTRAEAPRLLEYNWGGQDPLAAGAGGGGTRLTLWHNIDRRYIAWAPRAGTSASTSSIGCSAGTPIGRIVGGDAMKFGGWQRLHAEYAKQFGVESPRW